MQPEDHYIDLAAGKFASTPPENLKRIFSNFAASDCQTLLVHFHGGLNSREEGIARVPQLAPVYLEAGAYPVFFVWQSWVSEVVQNGVTGIFQETIFQRVVARIRQYLLDKLRSTPAARSPAADQGFALGPQLDQLLKDPASPFSIPAEFRVGLFALTMREERAFLELIQNDAVIREEIFAIANNLSVNDAAPQDRGGDAPQGRRQTRMRPEFVESLRVGGIGGRIDRLDISLGFAAALVKVLVRVCRRLAAGRDHGLLATIVEEVLRELYVVEGWFSWMKLQIEDAFKPDPATFGGTAFLEGLKALRDSNRKPRVVLVGHSAGSIYICNFLDNAKRLMPDAKFDVVFLTPAVSFERFAKTLQASKDAIAGFRCIALDDATEREDRWLPGIPEAYPASLLYFTSGVMEPDRFNNGDVPVVGMQRFFNGAVPLDSPAYTAVRDFFAADARRAAWSGVRFGEEVETVGRHHGGFAEDPGTRRVLQRIIREGI